MTLEKEEIRIFTRELAARAICKSSIIFGNANG
jgi:hypothetical protein